MKKLAFILCLLAGPVSAHEGLSPAFGDGISWSLMVTVNQNSFMAGGYTTEAKCEEARDITAKSLKKAKMGKVFCIAVKGAS